MANYVPSTDQLVVEVFVRDAGRARDFYAALGFELVEDRGTFIGMTWEGHKIFLDERPDMPRRPTSRRPTPASWSPTSTTTGGWRRS